MLAAAALVALSGCSTVSYYSQLANGQYDLLRRRQPIEKLVKDPNTPAQLRQRLQLAMEARAFASDHIGLPRNASYTEYSDLGRSAAVWAVYATDEFSVTAQQSCFPITGCVAYRGFFKKDAAHAYADGLHAKGSDVWISAVPTYSTLGWFDDPVLNTMMNWDDVELAGEIFHELTHQKLYVRNDTAFNESFATFVQDQGVREWCLARGLPPPTSNVQRLRWKTIVAMVLRTRSNLDALYHSGLDADAMRAKKKIELDQLRDAYLTLRNGEWKGYSGYDHWFRAGLDNATLLPFGLYDQWLPAFDALFRQSGSDWPRFFAAVKQLADEPSEDRQRALKALADAPTVQND